MWADGPHKNLATSLLDGCNEILAATSFCGSVRPHREARSVLGRPMCHHANPTVGGCSALPRCRRSSTATAAGRPQARGPHTPRMRMRMRTGQAPPLGPCMVPHTAAAAPSGRTLSVVKKRPRLKCCCQAIWRCHGSAAAAEPPFFRGTGIASLCSPGTVLYCFAGYFVFLQPPASDESQGRHEQRLACDLHPKYHDHG